MTKEAEPREDDPSDRVTPFAKENYAARAAAGESWSDMADEAARMKDSDLAAHLRAQDKAGKPADRSAPPVNRSSAKPGQQAAK